MTLINALIDALYALYLTNSALVAGGFLGALVIAYALMLAAAIGLKVTR
jgi:hypothetical protein